MAASQEVKSHHQKKRPLLAAEGRGHALQVLSTVRETDQMSYEFLLMVQCFYIEYLEMSENCGALKMEDGFSL